MTAARMSHFGGGGEDFYRAQAAVKFIANDEIDERADDSGVIAPTIPEISRPSIPELIRPPVEAA